jgi:hypothetical protein
MTYRTLPGCTLIQPSLNNMESLCILYFSNVLWRQDMETDSVDGDSLYCMESLLVEARNGVVRRLNSDISFFRFVTAGRLSR